MIDDPRVEQLLEELLESGGSPEEVCRANPELLPQVRAGWQRLRTLEAEVGALFPQSTFIEGATPPLLLATDLPQHIRGHEVEAVLGRGGMGVVYKAWHLRLNRPVALKMLLAGAYALPEEQERFLREVEAVASLSHGNIVQVHDVGDLDGRPYFTMELVEGGSLAQKLAGAPQPAGQAAALVATLAKAIHVAHQSGIVHRDLKPANVLLTADGTPKITDFGLARRVEDNQGLTLSGVPVGTPSYMAPEQARGQKDAIGPAGDVYALGAILYEMLTGRPPFRAATAAETLHQVITLDPVPPSWLNHAMPRDLETICLKCLHKEPERRYTSAAALADDLMRFGEGRPIQARRVGWAERSWRWGRRNPTAAALVATALALVGLAGGGGVWLVQQRAEQRAEATRHDAELRSDVGTAVAQADRLRKGFHFREARELLEQARQRLEPAGPDELRRQVDQGLADLDLAEHLDAARVKAATARRQQLDLARVELLYASAFAEAGLGREGDDVEAVAANVRKSAVSEEVIAALDDWAAFTRDGPRREWLLAVARKADPNPGRARLRQPDLWNDGKQLANLPEDLKVAALSPEMATALGRVLRLKDMDAVPLLTAAQKRARQDFRLNLELGLALNQSGRSEEALGHFRAALAVRPESSAAYNGLGTVLFNLGRRKEAGEHFEEALQLDPRSDVAHQNLGVVLQIQGRLDEAIGHFEQAVSIDPHFAWAHANLGTALAQKGRLDEAIDHFEQALRLDPENAAVSHANLGTALGKKGQLKEAIEHLQEAVRLSSNLSQTTNLSQATNNLAHMRYNAARAAISQNAENEQLGEQERTGRRQLALGWLKANVDLASRLQSEGTVVPWSLTRWQMDPELAAVRDPAKLAKLPAAERAEWQRLWADVSAIIAADPKEQGPAFAARRDWAKAADCYARALKYGTENEGHFWFEYAALSLLSGNRPGYVKACAHLVERCSKDKEPRSYHVARACTLAPHAVEDISLPGRLAEKELQGSREFWSLTEQGALAYRASRFQEAVPFFEQSLRADSKPGRAVVNWLWLALANQRLGKAEEARRWLVKAQAWLDQYGDGIPVRAEEELGLHLHNWLEAHVLRREAEAMIQPTGSRSGTENQERGAPRK
jgi:tetratricopeptide (TPR) repeat protein